MLSIQLTPADGAKLAWLLMQRLAQLNVIGVVTSNSGAQVYELPLSAILVSPADLKDLSAGAHALACNVCQSLMPGAKTVIDQLEGAPCLVPRCPGRLARKSRRQLLPAHVCLQRHPPGRG